MCFLAAQGGGYVPLVEKVTQALVLVLEEHASHHPWQVAEPFQTAFCPRHGVNPGTEKKARVVSIPFPGLPLDANGRE
jgi:hypothetical protein